MTQASVLLNYLNQCAGETYYDGMMNFHRDYLSLIEKAKGSQSKHQAWPGGYIDHLVECMRIGENIYRSLKEIRKVDIYWPSVVKVLYFHDVEKIFKYNEEVDLNKANQLVKDAVYAKDWFYRETLPNWYNVHFNDNEYNALIHIHGEKEYGKERIICPLGAFCHCCDILSARMWYDKPTEEEKSV